jgi:hypothetical protein
MLEVFEHMLIQAVSSREKFQAAYRRWLMAQPLA